MRVKPVTRVFNCQNTNIKSLTHLFQELSAEAYVCSIGVKEDENLIFLGRTLFRCLLFLFSLLDEQARNLRR